MEPEKDAFSLTTVGSRIPIVWAILLCPNYNLLPFLPLVRMLLTMFHRECVEAHGAPPNLICDLGAPHAPRLRKDQEFLDGYW